MTLEEKAESYTTEAVLHGRAGIDSVTEAYMAGYRQAQEDIALSDKLVRKEELDDEIQRSLKLAYEIAQLKSQIERMKCCKNCANSLYGGRGENGRCEDCGDKGKLSEWELKG